MKLGHCQISLLYFCKHLFCFQSYSLLYVQVNHCVAYSQLWLTLYGCSIIQPLVFIIFRYILCWWKFAVCVNMCDFRSAVHIHYDLNSSLSSFSISTFHSTFGFFHLKVNFFSVRVSEFPQECLFLFLLHGKEKIFCRSLTSIEQTSFRVQVSQIFSVKKNLYMCLNAINVFFIFCNLTK